MGAACKQTSSWEKYEGFENSLFSHWGFNKGMELENSIWKGDCVCVCALCLPCLSATVDKKRPGTAQKYLVGFVWMFVGLCWAIHTSPSPAAWRRGDSNHHHHLQGFGAPKHVFARNPGRLNRLCVFFLDRAAESRHLKRCFEWSLCLQRGEEHGNT